MNMLQMMKYLNLLEDQFVIKYLMVEMVLYLLTVKQEVVKVIQLVKKEMV